MSRSRLVILTAALAVGCQREAPRPLPLGRVLPSRAGALTVRLPSLVALDAMLLRLSTYKAADFVAQLQGFESGAALLNELPKSFGLDRSRLDALPQLGIDGAAPLGLCAWNSGSFLFALPLTNERTFRENVAHGLEPRYGKAQRKGSLTTFGEGNNRAAFTFVPGFALLAIGKEATDLLPSLASLPEKDSWAGDATTTALDAKLPPGEVQFHLTPGRLLAGTFRVSPEGLALSTVEGDLPESMRGLTLVPAPDLQPSLQGRGFLTLVASVEPSAFAPFAPRVASALQLPHPELWASVLPLLAPGAAISFGLTSKPHRAFTTVGAVDPRFLAVSALTRAAPKELLAKLKSLGVVVKPAAVQEFALATSPHTGPLRVRTSADWFALASPEAPPRPPPGDAAPASVALKAHLDFVAFNKALEALPAEGYGIGGESIRPFGLRIAAAVADLFHLTATIDVKDQHLTMNLTVARR